MRLISVVSFIVTEIIAMHTSPTVAQTTTTTGRAIAKLFTPNEAAEKLGVSVQTLANWRSSKSVRIPYLKVGGRLVKYAEPDLDAYLERQLG